jgi:glycosidase
MILLKCVIVNSTDIKVVLDYVPNHTSNESEWFVKASSKDEYYSDWYIWENGHIDSTGERKPPNNWVRLLTFLPPRSSFEGKI